MDKFPSKPYVLGHGDPKATTDHTNQMFRELYDAGSTMNAELTALETGTTGSGGVTIAQVMARVVLGI